MDYDDDDEDDDDSIFCSRPMKNLSNPPSEFFMFAKAFGGISAGNMEEILHHETVAQLIDKLSHTILG